MSKAARRFFSYFLVITILQFNMACVTSPDQVIANSPDGINAKDSTITIHKETVTIKNQTINKKEDKSFFESGWFWALVAVVVGGSVALSQGSTTNNNSASVTVK